MNEKQNNASFQYTYSASRQEELRKIRSKYAPREEDKMEQLRRLDEGATQQATVWALVVGIIGALLMGTGMSCCMVWGGAWFVPGIVVGLAGMAMMACAYPVYNRVLSKARARIAPEVLALTDELMK